MTSKLLTSNLDLIQNKSFSGVPKLISDLEKLCLDHETCDILFIVGQEETQIQAHRLILRTRCSSFQNLRSNEICRIPGTFVTPVSLGNPIVIKWPKANSEIFKEVLYYIYCGRINFSNLDVFETIAIAYELGIDDLHDPCEQHIISTLCVSNACTYLASALSLANRISDKNNTFYVDKCTNYIGEYASECVETVSFLQLPKEALIHLVSSDCLALEEEEVWRAILKWAKSQCKITQSMIYWTEKEKNQISQQLSGVINHVRILLIDSQVFAEEVEPSGAVPIEMALERYRFAALPNKFGHIEDKRFQPRTSNKLFKGSQLLCEKNLDFQRILNSWYGNPKQTWRLLYRASTNGYSADSFHRHCDGHSPTYVLVVNNSGDICGGFTDVAWSAPTDPKGRYQTSEMSFLFTLVNSKDVPPSKFEVIKKKFAVVHHQRCGPCFGAGADLFISNDCNKNINSYSNLPHSYDGQNVTENILMGDYNFRVKDYEVFTPNLK